MSAFADNVTSLVLNIISNDVFRGKENIIVKLRAFFFRRNLSKDIQNYIKTHDGSVLTTGIFENFMERYHIVEKIFSHVAGSGESITKKAFLEKLVVLFKSSGCKKPHNSFADYAEIYSFTEFLYSRIDNIFRGNLSENERYMLHVNLTSKEEILRSIESNSVNINDSISILGEKLNDIKNEGSFQKILDSISLAEYETSNLFHYLNKQMANIYGRDKQLEILSKFLDHSSNFSYSVITGPGGIGKSKLAYSFIQQQKEERKDWRMLFINEDVLKKIVNCNIWNHSTNTLLIFDYAGTTLDYIHKIFVKLADHEQQFYYKLRIILLDRVGIIRKRNSQTNEITTEYPNWYNYIINPQKYDQYGDSEYISNFLYSDFIELEGLAESDYRHLINDYVSAMHQKFLKTGKKKITYLSTEQISQIIGFSQRSSNSLKHSRPIYIILATDAVINGRDISSWNTTQMMKYIYDRDRKQWCDMIKDTLVLRGLENGLIYATIFGEWIVGNKLEIANGDACTDIENGLQDSNLSGPVKDWLMQMCELRPGETQSLKIKAYEPDIVGEFYVLKQLENCISSKNDWYNLIFNNLPKSIDFLERICHAYANTDQSQNVIEILKSLSNRITNDNVKEAEYIIKIWDLFSVEVMDKTKRAVAISNIQTICKKLFCQSRYIDEINIKLFSANPSEHSNSWREYFLNDYKLFFAKWPDSVIIATTYIEALGELASWYYRNGNLMRGNEYSKILNGAVTRCNTQESEVLISYINALGNIISGHYYINNKSDIEAGIDENTKLEVLAADFKIESYAIAYVEAVKKTIVQQSKSTADEKIEDSIDQFCMHIQYWLNNKEWFNFCWHIGSILPFIIELLFSYQKTVSAKKLLDSFLEINANYVRARLELPNLMISHFSAGIDKLLKSERIPQEIKVTMYDA